MTVVWILIAAVAIIVPASRGLWVELPRSGEKCLTESLQSKVVVMADYYSFYSGVSDFNATGFPPISVEVSSPYGKKLHHQENATYGQFSFTTTEAGNYMACFRVGSESLPDKNVTVGIEWRYGVAAEDWDSVAKKEKIEGLELELQKLEARVYAVHTNVINMVNREWEMRMASESANAVVAWCSFASFGICIAGSLLQLCYLKRYFRKKKLI